uniref:Putative mucin n=1 Tax=Rhipicephalus microplus TaxID=6941 RepID=A0A6G5A8M5_RHIMP
MRWVALCAVLCATLTAARPDFQKRSSAEGDSQETSSSGEEQTSGEDNHGPSSELPDTSSPQDTSDGSPSQPPETNNTQSPPNAFPSTEVPSGPPIETNPDCNVTDKSNHTYWNCTDVCGGDEVILVPLGRPCWLTWPTNLTASSSSRSDQDLGTVGVCADGQCISRSGPTEGTTESPEEPEESLEKCLLKILKKFLKDLVKTVKKSILKDISNGRAE